MEEEAATSTATVPTVAIVIVHYNCLNDTVRCLESISHLSDVSYFVVLVDNHSTDGSGEALRQRLFSGQIHFIAHSENRGFAAGNNVGIRYALERGATHVWLLNPDTTVSPNSLSELVRVSVGASTVTACGSKVLYAKDDESENSSSVRTIWSAGATIDFENQTLSMRGNQEVDRAQYDEESDADYLPGCSILLPASVIPLIGLMPEEYFMYFEETDWCTRMKRKGVSLRYVPSSVIWHHFQDVKMDQAFSVYYYNRNERLFWYRYGSIQQRLSLIGRVIFKSLPSALRALYHAPSDEHVAVFTAHVHSCLDFLLGRFGKQRQVTR